MYEVYMLQRLAVELHVAAKTCGRGINHVAVGQIRNNGTQQTS